MKPLTAAQFARIARDPSSMARLMSGREPVRSAPTSPLITLLSAIPPQTRAAMRGFRVDPDLGYSGSRVFQTAQQALAWLAPPHAGSSHPAESWRDKCFARRLWLDDILSHCASLPETIQERCPRLFDPARRPLSSPSDLSDPSPPALSSKQDLL